MKRLVVIFAVLLAVIPVACQDPTPTPTPTATPAPTATPSAGGPAYIADTEWRLVALGNADAPAAVVGGDPTARFTAETDMTGWTGCNSYGAGYSVRGLELRLDDLRWTERGCPSQELFRQEQRMQDLLAAVEWFEVSGDRLTIHSKGGQALVFERVGK